MARTTDTHWDFETLLKSTDFYDKTGLLYYHFHLIANLCTGKGLKPETG